MIQPQTSQVNPALQRPAILRRFRAVLGFFILGLMISGITAFPLQRELDVLTSVRGLDRVAPGEATNSFDHWILTVRDGLRDSYARCRWLGNFMKSTLPCTVLRRTQLRVVELLSPTPIGLRGQAIGADTQETTSLR